ncbi:hypothetical protein ACROYT_G018106 [Oculina patagonica]
MLAKPNNAKKSASTFGKSGFILVAGIISLCCYRRRTIIRIEGTVFTTASDSPVNSLIAPSYQQDYTHPPPIHFGQSQLHTPLPYIHGTATASGQPPPYTAASTGRSGGVYTPKPSYVAFSLAAVSDGCFDRVDCPGNFEICCNNECVEGSSCSTPPSGCTSDFSCPGTEYCCSGKCKADCFGPDPDSSSDTGPGDTVFIIIGSVFGFIVVAGIITSCCCRREKTVTIERTVITTSDSPFDIHVASSYQQGYSYPPPTRFGQTQTHIPPPYIPGTATASGQPSPYTAASTGRSGRIHVPKPSYGTVQSASRF